MGMGQNLEVLSNISLNSFFGYIYFALINFLFLALPGLTVGFIITYLEKIIAFIKLKIYFKKKICIFSEVNNKSLEVARMIHQDYIIIFANTNEKLDLNMKAVKINSKSDITFYMIYNNEEQNLTETLELINKYKNRDKTKIYVVNGKEEASTILDSTDKGNISVEIINENERMIFNLLNNKPLFLNSINKTISILIVGCENIGKEFLESKKH